MKLWEKTVILVLGILIFVQTVISTFLLGYLENKQISALLEIRAEQENNVAALLENGIEAKDYSDMTERTKKAMAEFFLKKYASDGYAIVNEEGTLASTVNYEVTLYEKWFQEEKSEIHHTIQTFDHRKFMILAKNITLWQKKYALYGVKEITGIYIELKQIAVKFFCVGIFILIISSIILMIALKVTIKELEENAKRQKQLFSALSHEIKTPITSLIGYSDTLLHVKLSKEQEQKALERIGDESRRMERLSSKLMSLIGLYENDSIQKEKIAIGKILNKARQITRCRMDEKQIKGNFSWDDFVMEMDEDLMESLVINLIDNAINASDEGGIIEVKAQKGEIVVEDHGRGIPVDELEKIKEPFYMIDKARKKKAGNIGLGLTLCTQIARLHGGKIVLESKEGEGTRASFIWLWKEEKE